MPFDGDLIGDDLPIDGRTPTDYVPPRSMFLSDHARLTAAVRRAIAEYEQQRAEELHTPYRDFSQRHVIEATECIVTSLMGS